MSTKQVKKYDNALKAKIILEVLRNEKTINEIASENAVVPCNIKVWKKQFLENIDLVFDKDKAVNIYKEKLSKAEREMEELYKQIGKLNTQLEWAKKKSKELGLGI